MKLFKIVIVFIITVIIGEYLSSNYGSSIFYNKYDDLTFKFNVISDGDGFHFLSNDIVYIVSSKSEFTYLDKNEVEQVIYVNNIKGFLIQSSQLFILIEGVENKLSVIAIKSVTHDYFIEDFEMYNFNEFSEVYGNKVNWNYLEKKASITILLNWIYLFVVVNFVFIFFAIFELIKIIKQKVPPASASL
ncbi:MAG: hypothetical protein ACJA1Z_003073 [Patiriisocius sp.]|jgi:hypothetical protein